MAAVGGALGGDADDDGVSIVVPDKKRAARVAFADVFTRFATGADDRRVYAGEKSRALGLGNHGKVDLLQEAAGNQLSGRVAGQTPAGRGHAGTGGRSVGEAKVDRDGSWVCTARGVSKRIGVPERRRSSSAEFNLEEGNIRLGSCRARKIGVREGGITRKVRSSSVSDGVIPVIN